MRLPTYPIYKYVRTSAGWQHCRAVYHTTKAGTKTNDKLKPNAVIVDGQEEVHAEGAYYINASGKWVKAGDTIAEAQQMQNKLRLQDQYRRITGGEELPEPPSKGPLLKDAVEGYLDDLKLKVTSKTRRPRTLMATSLILSEFAEHCGATYLSEIAASVSCINRHTAWVVEHGPTHSARTASNKFMVVLMFLRSLGAVPRIRVGDSVRPLGMKDAPKFVEPHGRRAYRSGGRRMFTAIFAGSTRAIGAGLTGRFSSPRFPGGCPRRWGGACRYAGIHLATRWPISRCRARARTSYGWRHLSWLMKVWRSAPPFTMQRWSRPRLGKSPSPAGP